MGGTKESGRSPYTQRSWSSGISAFHSSGACSPHRPLPPPPQQQHATWHGHGHVHTCAMHMHGTAMANAQVCLRGFSLWRKAFKSSLSTQSYTQPASLGDVAQPPSRYYWNLAITSVRRPHQMAALCAGRAANAWSSGRLAAAAEEAHARPRQSQAPLAGSGWPAQSQARRSTGLR